MWEQEKPTGWERWGKSESSLVWVSWSTQINICSISTERILGSCWGFSESQRETPSTTSKTNPSSLTPKPSNKWQQTRRLFGTRFCWARRGWWRTANRCEAALNHGSLTDTPQHLHDLAPTPTDHKPHTPLHTQLPTSTWSYFRTCPHQHCLKWQKQKQRQHTTFRSGHPAWDSEVQPVLWFHGK